MYERIPIKRGSFFFCPLLPYDGVNILEGVNMKGLHSIRKIADIYSGFSTTRKIALGFAAVILAGAILLTLPISSSTGEATSFIDALFAATTSVCVTGLVTVVTATYWSLFGHIVILILIQLGGFGVICCGIWILQLLRRKIHLKDRKMIQESYGLDGEIDGDVVNKDIKKNISNYDGLVKRIVRGTFIIEGIGAMLLAVRFIPQFGPAKGIWYSIFHAVSAFCNAGIDVLSEVSLMEYKGDALVNLTISFLIITGGIGFIVWWDVVRVIKQAIAQKKYKNMLFKRLSLHSKVAITTTIVLILIGTVGIFCFEYSNEKTMANESVGTKLLMSFFQSVTPRTAGYFTMLQENMTSPSYLLTIILMLIGGSPMGTAGGMKTTTIAMVVFCIIGVVKGKKDIEAFGRRISSENIRMGITVIAISLMTLILGVMLLLVVEPFGIRPIVYEAVSAVATVGLGYGMTPYLTATGKLVLILLMYIGRTGPITMAMVFGSRQGKEQKGVQLAEKKIIIG